MGLVVTDFQGELPGVSDFVKPQSSANTALNVLTQGALIPWSFASSDVRTLTNLDKSVVRIDETVYTFAGEFAVRSPLVDDANGRIYFNYDTPVNDQTTYVVYSRGTDGSLLGANSVVRKLGVPIAGTPSLTVTNATLSPPANEVLVAAYYACTLTNLWGEEGAMSSPTGQANIYSNTTVELTRPTGADGADIGYWNIYMTNEGQWQFMLQVPKATPSITVVGDAAKYPPLGEVCPSMDWLAPKTDLRGLSAMAGGFMAGYSGRFVCFSEPYLPHAWPSAYQYPVQYDIMGIVPVNGGAVIITDGRQYIAAGASPSVMQLQQLEMDAGCVSRDSIVDMGDYAVYASHMGLVKLGFNGVELISEAAWPRYVWQNVNPQNIKAMRLKHYYVFSLGTAVYVLDTTTKQVTRTDKIDLSILNRGFYDATDDKTYVIANTSPKKLRSIQLQQVTGAVWESHGFANNKGIAPSFAQIDSDVYPVTLTVSTSHDGSTFSSRGYVVRNRKPFRLVAGRHAFAKIKLTDFTGLVSRVVLTNDRGELV
jgi:hypothetical protein